MSLKFNSDQPNQRFCTRCLKKDPPVYTILELHKNINDYRWNRGRFVCDDCMREDQREYRAGRKLQFSEYFTQKHDETIEELSEQWDDPAYKKLKEESDRVYRVWDKADRRRPGKGIRRDWICEVIFRDLWFVDPNTIVEQYFERMGTKQTAKISLKHPLLQFVSEDYILQLLQEGYKEKARNKWSSIVDAIIRKYAGKDKMVATPPFTDPVTKEEIDNWYLLSHEEERRIREQIREANKRRADIISADEKQMVQAREEIEKRKKATKDGQQEGENQ